MQPNEDRKNIMSRKDFLRILGSGIAGASIMGVTGNLLWKMFSRPDETFFAVDASKKSGVSRQKASSFPYKLVSAFKLPSQIEAFELCGDRLVIAALNTIYLYTPSGSLENSFPVRSSVRDVAVDRGLIYVLYPASVEVYNPEGEWIRDWEACSEESDYCSLTVLSDHVFVTDAAHKNICKYTTEGGLVRFIQSPAGFIVPSYSFGITNIGGVVYCSNPGRHSVESYSPEGEYIGSFGQPGGGNGSFSGCCNPVYVAGMPSGEIITSEKGIPRISCYGKNGEFHAVLLDGQALGGGHAAREVRVWKDKLLVAGGDVLSVFQYDKRVAAAGGACADCGIDCPLRVGVTI